MTRRAIGLMHCTSRTIALALCAAVLTSLAACSTSVDPVIGDERPFTLWGVLDLAADTQVVRIFPVEDYPGIDRGPAIDAAVVSTDLSTGERREWAHRTRTYDDGDVAHVFWSDFTPVPVHRYRIEVRRSDGATSTAETVVPDVSGVDVSIRTDSGYVPVVVTGDSINVIGVRMRYEATNIPPLEAPAGIPIYPAVFHPVELDYDGRGEWGAGGTWQLTVDMYEDAKAVFAEYAQNCLINNNSPDIALRRVELRFVIASADWQAPGGVFHPDVLVEPGRLSNVTNGYGFIGAGELYTYRWTPSMAIRYDLGYRDRTPGRHDFSIEPPWPCFDRRHTSVRDLYDGA